MSWSLNFTNIYIHLQSSTLPQQLWLLWDIYVLLDIIRNKVQKLYRKTIDHHKV